MTSLTSIELNPPGKVKTSVIWLHGLGADGHDFEAIVPALQLPEQLGIRFVFPHAPIMPVTINMGTRMRAWYDISHPDLGHKPDLDGIARSAQQVKQLVEQEQTRCDHVILAGFSQGGVIALYLGLQHIPAVSGILALSTYLVDQARFKTASSEAQHHIPIMMMHGLQDPVIPLALAEQSKSFLKAHNYQVAWKTYPMPHSVHPEQIADISNWINSVATNAAR